MHREICSVDSCEHAYFAVHTAKLGSMFDANPATVLLYIPSGLPVDQQHAFVPQDCCMMDYDGSCLRWILLPVHRGIYRTPL